MFMCIEVSKTGLRNQSTYLKIQLRCCTFWCQDCLRVWKSSNAEPTWSTRCPTRQQEYWDISSLRKKWGPILFSHFVGILLGLIVQPTIIIIVLKFSSARRVDLGSGRFGAETRPGWRKNKERKNPVWPGCLAGWPYKTRSKTWL